MPETDIGPPKYLRLVSRALRSWASKYGAIQESSATRYCGFQSSGVPCFYVSMKNFTDSRKA